MEPSATDAVDGARLQVRPPVEADTHHRLLSPKSGLLEDRPAAVAVVLDGVHASAVEVLHAQLRVPLCALGLQVQGLQLIKNKTVGPAILGEGDRNIKRLLRCSTSRADTTERY